MGAPPGAERLQRDLRQGGDLRPTRLGRGPEVIGALARDGGDLCLPQVVASTQEGGDVGRTLPARGVHRPGDHGRLPELLDRRRDLVLTLVGELDSEGVPTLDEPLRRETVKLLRADASLVLDGHRSDRSIGASDRSAQPYRVRSLRVRDWCGRVPDRWPDGTASSRRPGPPS